MLNIIYFTFLHNFQTTLATEAPPPTTTQPIPTYAPEELPYKKTTDYIWSNFNTNATEIVECGPSDQFLFDVECRPWVELVDKKEVDGCAYLSNECIANGPLGFGASVVLRNTSHASLKVNSVAYSTVLCVRILNYLTSKFIS